MIDASSTETGEADEAGPAQVAKAMPRLSPAQQRVMKWLGKGWRTEPSSGSALTVNGKRVCNVDTLNALQRLDLVSCVEHGVWQATALGEQVTAELGL